MNITRSNLVFLFASILFFSGSVLAASGIARFIFITDPQTIGPGILSGDLKIQAQDANGNEIKTQETIDLGFSSTSATGEFLNASANPVSTVMSKGTANRSFYYRDSNSGIHTLTIKAQGRDSGTSWTVSQAIMISGTAAPSSIPVPLPASLPPAPQPLPSSSGGSSSANINADAGSDQTVTVGSLVDFKGTAVGLKKEPMANARFWWNFGDGETQEGKSTAHIFRIPGTYIVGLHVSSGEYAASDYATVHVLVNQMRMSRVVEGADGFMRVLNPLNVESDIGDWIIEDATGKKFFIPSKTKVAPGTEISFSNAATGLLQTDSPELSALYPLTVQYPNGTVAFTYAPVRQDVVGRAASSSPVVPAAVAPSTSYPRPEVGSKAAQATTAVHAVKIKPTHSFSREDAKKDVATTGIRFAALPGGFSFSSRILFAGAVGLSALGALGFFVLKQFLM